MSLNAMTWALGLRPERLGDVAPAAHVTLIAIADCADSEGCNAWPSVQRLADRRGLSVRTIRRHLEQLETAGLILRGDQGLVRNLPSNRRPVVWDLPIHFVEKDAPPVENEGVSVDNSAFRGDTNVTPESLWGDTPGRFGVTSDVTQTVLKPSMSSTYSTPGMRSELSTEDDTRDYPERECIHGAPAVRYDDKRSRRRLPLCPLCRVVYGRVVLDQEQAGV